MNTSEFIIRSAKVKSKRDRDLLENIRLFSPFVGPLTAGNVFGAESLNFLRWRYAPLRVKTRKRNNRVARLVRTAGGKRQVAQL
jgi:hypothetical protein